MSGGPPVQPPPPPPPPAQPPYPAYLPPPYGVPQAQYASASFWLGIVSLLAFPLGCFCGFTAVIGFGLGIAAAVLGFMARSQIAASRGTLGGDGKTLVGIITGVTGAAIALLIFMVSVLLFGAHTPR